MVKIGIYFFRTLYSQSISSLTVEKISSALIERRCDVSVKVLKNFDHYENLDALSDAIGKELIIYKTNFQDFEYGIRFFENIWKKRKMPIILIGPFACLNKSVILEKYPFVDRILSPYELDEFFDKKFLIETHSAFREILDRRVEEGEKGKYVNLERCNGCIYKCNFCHIPQGQTALFTKNAYQVVDEIELLVEKYGKRYFIFNDPIFWKGKVDNEFVEKFCDEIKKRNLKIFFMIYLALGTMIPDELLDKLYSVGLIRVFFGIENVTKDFQKLNPKKTSRALADNFIFKLRKRGISFHIGFMLFHPSLERKNIYPNIHYLWELKKLFRLGVIREKMRIIPNSPNTGLLEFNNKKIDQAYNYKFLDQETEKTYEQFVCLIDMVDYRVFESFFTNLDLLFAILQKEEKSLLMKDIIVGFIDLKENVNNKLLSIMEKIIEGQYADDFYSEMIDLYSEAESFYLFAILDAKRLNLKEYLKMIPHGQESKNVKNLYD